MHSPIVSVVGTVVILCSCVLSFLESTKLCICVQPRSYAQVWAALWVGIFPQCVSVTPCSLGGRAVSLQSGPRDLAGGRIAPWRRCECVIPETGNAEGSECCLSLWVLHTFENGCCRSSAAGKESDPLPYLVHWLGTVSVFSKTTTLSFLYSSW